nr:UBN2 domain-containing protein [Tanacetum cinerariifolium]
MHSALDWFYLEVKLEVVSFEQQDDDLKRKLAKNNYAKMVNALPKKDNKIDLLVQQYEKFTILEEECIDSDFARFETIITSLKALDKGFSSMNYIRKFLRALHPKWRAKVTVIKNRKICKKESVKSISLKAKKETSDDETSTSRSDDEEYAMPLRNFKKFFRRKMRDLNNLIGDCTKPSRNKDLKAFIGGSWNHSENDTEDKTNDETCFMAQSSNLLGNQDYQKEVNEIHADRIAKSANPLALVAAAQQYPDN